jgi:hypothetical protein
MDIKSELIWRELLSSAAPSSDIPRVVASDFCTKIDMDAVEAELKLLDLGRLGAVAALTAKELSRLASHKRISGDFVMWDRGLGSPSYFRVVDPHGLRQSMVAQTIAIEQELRALVADEASVRRRIAGDELSELWRWQFKEGATEEWKRRLEEGMADAPAGAFGSVDRQFWDEMQWLRARLILIAERNRAIESRLDEFAQFKIPDWASAPRNAGDTRDRIPKNVQREVWRRDQGRCVECGSQDRLEYDHVIPWSKGGANTARNIQLLCETCNRRKNNRI